MAGGLTAWRVDQPQRLICHHQTGKDAGVAQQALEALMRRRLPAIERAARIRIDAHGLDADEELPLLLPIAEFGDGPCGLERGGVFRESDEQFIGNGRAPGCSGDMARFPAKDLLDESPRIRESGLCCIPLDKFGDRTRIDRALPYRGEPEFLKEAGSDDKTDRLNMVQPFKIGVAI